MKKSIFKNITVVAIAILTIFSAASCKKKDNTPTLAGTPGNPRFNLQFDNESNVDLDLHVLTPNGIEINYLNPQDDGGTLDVDCKCSVCSNGPNENIFWPDNGSAPKGTYKVWVKYFKFCGSDDQVKSNFTLRIVKNNEVLKTYTGTLTNTNSESSEYTFQVN